METNIPPQLRERFENMLYQYDIGNMSMVELLFAAYNMDRSEWVSVEDSKPSIEKYYQLAHNDDVYLDVFKYRPHGIDGDTGDYYRSVNDNSTLADYEVTHFKEFNTDAPNWADL